MDRALYSIEETRARRGAQRAPLGRIRADAALAWESRVG